MSAYYPYAGTLSHNPEAYRRVHMNGGETFVVPPNVTAILMTGVSTSFTLTLPDGTEVPYATGPTIPISLESIYPKGKFSVFKGAGGDGVLHLYGHP